MREIRADVFQGRFHNLLISKNNTFWVPQISRITFQVVLLTSVPCLPCTQSTHGQCLLLSMEALQEPTPDNVTCAIIRRLRLEPLYGASDPPSQSAARG